MILIRFLVLAFNVAIVVFLLFRMFQLSGQPMPTWRKAFMISGGILLLLAPFGMFFGFFAPGIQYFLLYPVAIGLYLYMIRDSAA
jgi:hypothetical protein